MKKYLTTAMFFAIYGLASGVYFREFTKFNGFTERTTLGFAHPHILALGLAGFILIALFAKTLNLKETKTAKAAYVLYLIGVIVASVMMIVRGSMEVLSMEITGSVSGMIAGIAGLGHVATAVGMIMFISVFIKAEKAEKA